MKIAKRSAWAVVAAALSCAIGWSADPPVYIPPQPNSPPPKRSFDPAPPRLTPPTVSIPTEEMPGKSPSAPVAPPTPAPAADSKPKIVIDEKPAPVVEAPKLPDSDDDEPTASGSFRRSRFGRKSDSSTLPAATAPSDSKKSDQGLSMEWVCPANIKVKQPFSCEIVVRNSGSAEAMNVLVRNKAPKGMRIVNAEPKATPEGDVLVWSLGTMDPKQERRIKLDMVADQRGEVACNAMVSSTMPVSSRMKVCEPQLVIKQTSPEKVMVGDAVTIAFLVSNPGDGPAEQVVIRAKLPEGLHSEKGQEVNAELGTLAPGETRTIKLVCQSVKGGAQKIMSMAMGEGGLRSNSESTTSVNEAKLEIAMNGPKLRYLDRSATYKVMVSNPGNAAAADVKVTAVIPAGFKVSSPSNGGQFDSTTRTLSWFVGAVGPNEKKELTYKCIASQVGDYKHLCSAEGARGVKSAGECKTKVEGIAALVMEMVDVDDPIEVGSETAYEIRVTNQGSREATNVEIRALVPKEMSVKGGQGPTQHKVEGQEIIFAPLPKLAPRADAIFRVFVKGIAAGDVRFRARLVSDALSEPVIGEEGTKIYTDEKN